MNLCVLAAELSTLKTLFDKGLPPPAYYRLVSMTLRFFLITVMVAGSGLCHGQENGAVALNNARQPSGSGFSEPLKLDLNTPERNPPECPDWARVETPAWVKPFIGVNGAP